MKSTKDDSSERKLAASLGVEPEYGVVWLSGRARYLKPVVTPVAGVAGIWLAALALHLSHRRDSSAQQHPKLMETRLKRGSVDTGSLKKPTSKHLGK